MEWNTVEESKPHEVVEMFRAFLLCIEMLGLWNGMDLTEMWTTFEGERWNCRFRYVTIVTCTVNRLLVVKNIVWWSGNFHKIFAKILVKVPISTYASLMYLFRLFCYSTRLIRWYVRDSKRKGISFKYIPYLPAVGVLLWNLPQSLCLS